MVSESRFIQQSVMWDTKFWIVLKLTVCTGKYLSPLLFLVKKKKIFFQSMVKKQVLLEEQYTRSSLVIDLVVFLGVSANILLGLRRGSFLTGR